MNTQLFNLIRAIAAIDVAVDFVLSERGSCDVDRAHATGAHTDRAPFCALDIDQPGQVLTLRDGGVFRFDNSWHRWQDHGNVEQWRIQFHAKGTALSGNNLATAVVNVMQFGFPA
ncbi:hypothetical protein D3C76_1542360 [compost metagenome]